MTASSVKLRPGTYGDFCLLVQWAYDEFEWEMAFSDYRIYTSFLPADREWFWVAENEKGEPVGFIAAVEHEPNDGYIGLFFVKKDHRGSGVGRLLFDKAMKTLENRNIGLVAEPHVMNIYTKKNFTVLPDYSLVTAEGFTTKEVLQRDHTIPDIVLEEPSPSNIDRLMRYDCSVAARNRPEWCTRHYLHNPYAKSLVALDTRTNSIVGIGTAKVIYMKKLKIGPLYADSADIAKMITFGLLGKFMKDPDDYKLCMFCMLPDKSIPRNALAEELGLETPYPMNHMFTKYAPPILKDKVFCLGDCDVNLV